MEVKEDLDTFEDLLNIFLVYKQARKACLIEYPNIEFKYNHNSEKVKRHLYLVFEAIKKYDLIGLELRNSLLVSTTDDLKEYLQDKIKNSPDVALGKILGFFCFDHNFGDETKDRISGTISVGPKENKNQLLTIVEVCEKDKVSLKDFEMFLKDKVEKIKSVLPLEKYEVYFNIEFIHSIISLGNKMEDFSFLKKNLEEYKNGIANAWGFPTSKLEDFFLEYVSTENKKYFEFWRKFWSVYVIGEKIMKIAGKLPEKEIQKIIPEIDDTFLKKIQGIKPEELFLFFDRITVNFFREAQLKN